MVPVSEIADPANAYNLNIPRYIDTSEPEDLHDLGAHLNGGIPDTDIDALNDYWTIFPTLRNALFKANGRPGYSDPLVETQHVKTIILSHNEFTVYQQRVDAVFAAWREAHEPLLLSIDDDTVPRKIIEMLSEDLLTRFRDLPLLDRYDVYQKLMDYWDEIMQDDVYLIANDGWMAGRILRTAYDKETPDFTTKQGQKTIKHVGELIPASLVIAKFFDDERRKLEQLEAEIEEVTQCKEEFEEEHGDGEGALVGLEGIRGITKGNVQERVMELRYAILKTYLEGTPQHIRAKSIKKTTFGDSKWIEDNEDEDGLFSGLDISHDYDEEGLFEELDVLYEYLQLMKVEKEKKDAHKQTLDNLYKSVIEKYAKLTEKEIKTLVITDKWFPNIQSAIAGEVQRLTQALAERVKELEERYAQPLPDLAQEAEAFSARVEEHLRNMGVDSV